MIFTYPLDCTDDERKDKGDSEAKDPHPILDLIFWACRINDDISIRFLLLAMLFKEWNDPATSLEHPINANACLMEQGLECNVDNLILDDKFGHGGADHDHHTAIIHFSN